MILSEAFASSTTSKVKAVSVVLSLCNGSMSKKTVPIPASNEAGTADISASIDDDVAGANSRCGIHRQWAIQLQ
jgi:hypothetical protein